MSDAFTQFEYEGWQRAAGKYEAAWSGLTRLFVPALVRDAGVEPGDRVLDVASGPGYVAEAARERGAVVRGIDFSPEMVRLAGERYPKIEFSVGDAQTLSFPDGSFDVVVINFGLLHLAKPERALAEARRVLVAGGRIGFTAWAEPAVSPGARVVDDAIRSCADMSVELPKGPEYFGFGAEEGCREILGRAGFDASSVTFRTVVAEWEVPSAAHVFEAELDAGVRTAALLRVQSAEVLAEIRSRIEAGLMRFAREGRLLVPYAANVVAAGV